MRKVFGLAGFIIAAGIATSVVGSTARAQVPTVPTVPTPLPSVVPTPSGLPNLPLSYEIHTVYRAPDDTLVETYTDALMLVPTPVDVDGTLNEDAAPDVLVQLTVDAGRATVRVSKLATAPADLPLLIEAIVADPRGTTELKVAYGYDTLASVAPSTFSSTVQLIGAARITSFVLDVETVGAGDTLAVIAEVYEEGPDRVRRDPQRGRVTYAPVPTVSHIGLIQGSDLGISQSGVDLTTNIPTKVDVVIDDIQGDRAERSTVTIDDLPNVLSLLLTDHEDGRRTWSYQASARVDDIALVITDTRANTVVEEFAIVLKDMATSALLVQDTATHATFEANSPIGAIAAGNANGRPITWLDEPAYLFQTNRGVGDSFAFRILGLSRAEFDTGDPFLIDVNIAPGPFHVLIEDDDRTLNAIIRDLPGHVRIAFSTDAGTVEYTGSAPIGSITVDVVDPSGVSGRATEMHLALRDVPTELSFAFGANGGTARMDAHEGRIGSVELLLTSGPDLAVDTGFDGIVLQDVPSHYALAARLTGLQLVTLTTGDAPYVLELVKTAGPFLVSLQQDTRDVRIEVLDLPDSFTATFDPDGEIAYEGSAVIGLITVVATDPDGLAGRATALDLRIVDVPRELRLDFSTQDAAVIDAHGSRIGSIDLLLTSGPTLELDPGYDGLILEDVPTHYALVARLTGLRLASVSTAAPYGLDLRKDAGKFLVRLSQDARFTEVRIHDLPDSLQAVFDPSGSLTYEGSAPIGELTAVLHDPAGISGLATDLDLRIVDLPENLTLSLPAAGRATIDAHDAAIGSIDLLLTSGPVISVPAGYDGIVLREADAFYALVVHLEGLRYASVTSGAPYELELRKTAGPFIVDLLQGTRVSVIEVLDLPDDIHVTLDPNGTASYTASAPIGRIDVSIADPAGVTGRATSLDLELTDVPAALDLTFGSGATTSVDAHGAAIGLIDLHLTSGPTITVPAPFDGLVLEDVADHYALAARLHGLQHVSATTEAPYSLDIRKTAGPFLINLEQGARTTRVEIRDLPSSLQATLDPTGSFAYVASAPIGSLVAALRDPAGVSGRATSLDLTVEGLPAALDLSFGGGLAATIDAHGASIGSIDLLLTSGPRLALPPGVDGVILRDTAAAYVLAAKITGLELVSVSTTAPYALDLRKSAGPFLVDLEQGLRTTMVRIDDLPSSLQATIDPALGSMSYVASAPIGSVTALLRDPAGVSGRATALDLTLRELPAELDLTFGGSGASATIDAHGAAIGSIDLLLTSGPNVAVADGFDGVLLRDLPTEYVLAARITGLRSAVVSTIAPYRFALQKTAGPFVVHLTQGLRDVLVTVRDLPSSIDATLDPSGTLTYTGSAVIGSLDATIVDPAGVTGRATRLELGLRDIPTALTLDFGTSTSAGIDAHGGSLGLVTLLATSGPDLAVDAGYEGVVLEDVPSHFAIAARLSGLRVARVTTGVAPYTLSLGKTPGPFLVRLVQGARTTLVKIHDLPSTMTATLDPAGSLAYTASSPVGELTAEIVDPAGVAGRATRASALLRGIPTALDVSWASTGTGVTADAKGATVGLLEVLLTSGPNATLPADRDGLIFDDLSDRYVLFGRITGLRSVTFAQGPPPSFDLRTTGGRLFQVALSSQGSGGVAVTTALIDRLPSQVSIAFTSSTALRYRASAPVDALTLDAFDPAGISGRAKSLHGRVLSVPAALDASWSSTGVITLDALGGTVGLVELQLTSGPNSTLPAAFDGILLEDLSDRYVVFARVTGLKRLVGTQSPEPDVSLTTTGGRIFKVDLNQLDGSKVEYTRVTLDNLPTTVRVRVAGKEMFYDASTATNSLVLDTNSGDRWNMHADIRNPLPARLAFCAASDGFCTGYARSSGAGSFKVDASEHTTINLYDCVRPLNANCVRGAGSEFTQVDNWRVRHFAFDADADSTGFDGYTFNNTNGHALSGYLLRIGGSVGFEASINNGYWSSNRRVEWDWWGLDKDKSGSVNCAGSSFSIRIIGIWIGVTDYVC